MSTALPEPCFAAAPYDFGEARRLERELGLSHAMAQILVRRGMGEPAAARSFLAADETHDPSAFDGIGDAVDLILRHVRGRSRIVVHGDYDVDGVCSTAVLVRSLRRLAADPHWFLPSRAADGYGLSAATVARLAGEGTALLITVDCAITAVEEVAAARAVGLDVVVTDHHAPRADGALPDCPIVHPAVGAYPFPELCATAVAAKLAEALEREAGYARTPDDADLDLVALATVADCVPLLGENRALVRAGLCALAGTEKPGLRALMDVAQVDPSGLDAQAIAFRLAPRINAAGRLHRADAGLELLLSTDAARATAIADELDSANADRRNVETRIRFQAEAQVAEAGERAAYVLAGEDWHKGVIGIVAARIAERHHRPAVLVALDGRGGGTGSGRSISGFDLLGGLNACAGLLDRHGGHRAAAGLELRAARLEEFRAAFEAHAAAALRPQDLVPVERVDAVVSGGQVGLELAEELMRLQPCGMGNPEPALLLSAASLCDPVAMGEGKHLRFTVEGGGARSRAVAFGVAGGRLPVPSGEPAEAIFRLGRNTWRGAVEPRLELRAAHVCTPAAVRAVGEPPTFLAGVLAELDEPLEPPVRAGGGGGPGREVLDRRGNGVAGTISDLVHSAEDVLVVCADVPRRLRGLDGRLGGFELCSHLALERDPALAAGRRHLVALDPPAHAWHAAALEAPDAAGGGFAHLAWGEPELGFAQKINELELGLRAPLAALYRALRDAGGAAGEEFEDLLRGQPDAPRSPSQAGRALRVLTELGLVSLDRDLLAAVPAAAERTALERSPAFRAYEARREDGERYLSRATALAA